jgi:hypothetical protein
MIQSLDAGVLTLQAGIAAAFLVGVYQRDPSVVVNAAVALAAVFLPAVTLGDVVPMGSPLSLWIGAAGFLHCLGMLGLYESVWWWDHLTHTVSAALVAALVYAVLLAGVDGGTIGTRGGAAGVTVLLTLAVGVAWELVELAARDVGDRFDVEPVLVHYGWRDTAFDLGFDALGAVVVVLLDLRVFLPVAAALPGVADASPRLAPGLAAAVALLS